MEKKILSCETIINAAKIEGTNENVHDFSDMEIIDMIDDILTIGVRSGKLISVNVHSFKFTIDLSHLIGISCRLHQNNVITSMITHNYRVTDIRPEVIIMYIETYQYDVVDALIDNHEDITFQNYRAVFQLAAVGQLHLLKKIMSTYTFIDVADVSSKICVHAAINNHVPILQYFCPYEGFSGAPDIINCYMINSIINGGHLDVIKYFVNGGVSIKQQSYEAVRVAARTHRTDIMKYFYHMDPDIVNILSKDELDEFGFNKVDTNTNNLPLYGNMKLPDGSKYFVTKKIVGECDTYYRCSTGDHIFTEGVWNLWFKAKGIWICPQCKVVMPPVVYKNL
jgi:hypothetical protein